jgi:hypothetical protein
MDGETLVWGWHRDPYGIHEERWVSGDGAPTKLVRDGGHESYDPPPAADGTTGPTPHQSGNGHGRVVLSD